MQQQAQQRNAFPGSLSDLVASFENVKQKGEQVSQTNQESARVVLTVVGTGTAAHRMTNLDQVHKLLDGGYSNMPQPQDTEKCVRPLCACVD